MHSLLDRSVHLGYACFGLTFELHAVYRQRVYLYLLQFSDQSRYWLQRYRTRIRTLGSSLVDWKIYTCDCLNNYVTTFEFEELDDYLQECI